MDSGMTMRDNRGTLSKSYPASNLSTTNPTQTALEFKPDLRGEKLSTNRLNQDKRVVPKVMSNIFLQANWEQQTKESAVVDGTSCCIILECLVTSIACIT